MNPIKKSYQDGLGRTTQTLDHVVVVYISIETRESLTLTNIVMTWSRRGVWDRYPPKGHIIAVVFMRGVTFVLVLSCARGQGPSLHTK